VAICILKFGGKKYPWVDLKIKDGNCEPPLKVCVDTLIYLQCTCSLAWTYPDFLTIVLFRHTRCYV